MRIRAMLLLAAEFGCAMACRRAKSTEESCREAYTEQNQLVTGTAQEILIALDAGARGPVAPLPRERFMNACRRLPPEAVPCASQSYRIIHRECARYESQTARLGD
jgi:hypothetical protein